MVKSEPAGARLDRLELHRLRVPLVRPYKLAFGALEAFDTLLVEAWDDQGRSGFGEATVLHGYTDETIDSAWRAARQLADALVGQPLAAAARRLTQAGQATPFTATALHAALDMLQEDPLLHIAAPLHVPLLALLNADAGNALAEEVEQLLAQGYGTFKVKAGLPGADDPARIARIQQAVAGRARLRIDANQAYGGARAAEILAALDPSGIELFEQPCAADDWAGHAQAAAVSRVPLMLDESIYGLPDIERAAAERLAAFVKVKAVKFVSLRQLHEAILRIRALGLQPVLGNGVACDPGCWMEACVAAATIDNAGEMNGYLKVRVPLLQNPPRIERGAMVLPANERPCLDRDAVERQRTARHVAARAQSMPA